MKSKQVIVIRKDLNMRKGKMVTQGAHASMKVIIDSMDYDNGSEEIEILRTPINSPLKDWINGLFTKICVGVDSEAELIQIYEKAITAGLLVAMIEDTGLTEFNGVPTKTCLAIGPNWDNDIDLITGHLKLL